MSPFEAFFGKRPDISHMCIWFSNMFIHHPKDLGARKLGVHGYQVKFLGYLDGTAGYSAYDPQTHRVSVIRAPIFREEAHPHPSTIFELMEDSSDDDSPALDSAT